MFDVEFVVPVCGALRHRIDDFKRYGLVNRGSRSVLLNVLVSNEDLPGIDRGWPEGFAVNVIQRESPNYIGNIYKFYADLDPSSLKSRWLVRLDDDSCTDVDGLVDNLDYFYDHTMPFHLGDLNPFHYARATAESGAYAQYRDILGRHERISGQMRNEIECGVMSVAAVAAILKNRDSIELLRRRSEISGGYGDCVVALASALARVWPVDCPFITHQPLVSDFSLLGGVRNHIHQFSRWRPGENAWGRVTAEGFDLVAKVVDNDITDSERGFVGKRFLIEGPNSMKIVEFLAGYKAAVKPDSRQHHWMERDGFIVIMVDGLVADRLKIDNSGTLVCDGLSIRQI
jgi:hypothetical protein